MFLYRRSVENPNRFTDYGDYPDTPPFEAGNGWEWVEGHPPDTASPYVFKTMNEILEQSFMSLLPKHLGQPYLTPDVINTVMSAKLSVTEANRLDPTGSLGTAIVSSLSLPTEMAADRAVMLSLFQALH